ncbi:unnamed protein product, partial [Rangifer tarandus platyrhynchus]
PYPVPRLILSRVPVYPEVTVPPSVLQSRSLLPRCGPCLLSTAGQGVQQSGSAVPGPGPQTGAGAPRGLGPLTAGAGCRAAGAGREELVGTVTTTGRGRSRVQCCHCVHPAEMAWGQESSGPASPGRWRPTEAPWLRLTNSSPTASST